MPENKPKLHIDWASYKAAKYACEHWHYSKVLPVGKLLKVGAWEDDVFIGVVLFGYGANKSIGTPYQLKQNECVELVRVALTKHSTPVSQIMARAIKMLRKTNKGVRLIVSYADKDQGHLGIIYQATNWIYTGEYNVGNRQGFMIHGKLKHNKSVHSKGVRQTILEVKKHLDSNAYEVYTKGKHKYLMPLDKEIRKQVKSLAKPYPRPVGAIGSTSDVQSEDGSSNLTAGLTNIESE